MVQIVRSTFGSVPCEMAVERSTGDVPSFVAWALRVRTDGHLDPLYDGADRLLRETADTAPHAITAIRRRLTAQFGTEQPAPPNGAV